MSWGDGVAGIEKLLSATYTPANAQENSQKDCHRVENPGKQASESIWVESHFLL